VAFTNNKGRTQSSLSEINITPFVDVVLVLLVMFMVTAPILQSGIEVDVPKTKTVKEISEERLVITIDKDQKVYLGNDPSTSTRLPTGCTIRFAIRRARASSSAPTRTCHSEPSQP
jgi:biopolymer transport protein ExbD/biopolymer transport protein TolR